MMNHPMQKVIDTAESAMGLVGLIAIIIICAGVFTRFILKVSIAWSDELLRTLFIWAYFVGTGLQYNRHGLMRIELLENKVQSNPKISKFLYITNCIVMLVFSGVAIYYVSGMIQTQVVNQVVTTTSGSPAWIQPMGFLVGSILIGLFALLKIGKSVRQ